MTDASPLRLEHEGGLAVLTISRPPLNLWGREMWDALPVMMNQIAADPPRTLLIRAEGRVVTAGVDVENFRGLDVNTSRALWDEQMVPLHTLETLPCPTIFAAHALCLTAGMELALGCDLVLAARSAQFGLVERRVGLTPSNGGVQRLAAAVGINRARDLIFTGDLYDAETMREWGFVTRVFDDEGFDEAAHAFALEMASSPTLAHAATKDILRAFVRGGVTQADREMPEISSRLFLTEDLNNAVAAFLENGPRHKATFKGR